MTTQTTEPVPLDRTWDEFVADAHLQEGGMSERAVDSRRRRVRRWSSFWVAITWGAMIGGMVGNLAAELLKHMVKAWLG